MASPKVTGHQYMMSLVTPVAFNDTDKAGVAMTTVATHQMEIGTLPANSRIVGAHVDVDALMSTAGTCTLDLGYWQNGAVVDADELTAGGVINLKVAGRYSESHSTTPVIPTAQVYTVPTLIVAEVIVGTAVLASGQMTVVVNYVVEGKADLVVET